MNETAHTPGPWVPKYADRVTLPQDVDGSMSIAHVYGRKGASHEQAANRNLIAAAPDLLATLKLVVSQIEDYERVNNLAPNPGRKHCWDSVAQAHAIIAKAEGRPMPSPQGTADGTL